MFLHFEDHSFFAWTIDRKRYPSVERLIKVFATEKDPRIIFGKATLTVVSLTSEPFTHEVFNFPIAGKQTGTDLKTFFRERNFTEYAKQIARSLIRFSAQQKDGKGNLFVGRLDGIGYASKPSQEKRLHLDVFLPESIELLKTIVDIENPKKILSFREANTIETQRASSREKER